MAWTQRQSPSCPIVSDLEHGFVKIPRLEPSLSAHNSLNNMLFKLKGPQYRSRSQRRSDTRDYPEGPDGQDRLGRGKG